MPFIIDIILRDLSCNNEDISICINKNMVSGIEFWDLLLNSSDHGFKQEKCVVFSYDSSINSLSEIYLLFDILYGLNIRSSLEEDIKLIPLLYNYAHENSLKTFLFSRRILIDITKDDIDELELKDKIMRYVHPDRWKEVSIESPLEKHSNDQYEEYLLIFEDYVIEDDYPRNTITHIYLSFNKRTVMPYLTMPLLIKRMTKLSQLAEEAENTMGSFFEPHIHKSLTITTINKLFDKLYILPFGDKSKFVDKYMNDVGKQLYKLLSL